MYPPYTSLFLLIPLSLSAAIDSPVVSSDSLVILHPALSATSAEAMERFQRRHEVFEQLLLRMMPAAAETTLSFRISRLGQDPLVLSREGLSGVAASTDPVAEHIRRRDVGHAPGLNIGQLLSQGTAALFGKRPPAPQGLGGMPSELEITVLRILWTEKQATGAAIYAHLDSLRLTAGQLQNMLATMTERGLLHRQQISPRNEFTIVTPFGPVTIEQSRLNRRNREHLYRAAASAETVWRLLDATLFDLQRAPGNSTDAALIQHIRRLMLVLASQSRE